MTIPPSPRNAPPVFSENRHESMGERIVRLEPRLRGAARGLGNTSSLVLDDDDLFQAMAVELLQRQYLTVDGYVVKHAKRRALDHLRLDTIYRRYVLSEAAAVMVVDDDGDGLDLDDFLSAIPSEAQSPEEALLARERLVELRARLSDTQRCVVDLLMQGYSKSEIANRLGVSRPRVSQHVAAIRRLVEV